MKPPPQHIGSFLAALIVFGLGLIGLTTPVFAQTPDPFDPNASGSVSALAIQPDGKIVVGGSFTSLGGKPRANIARLNSDGTVESSYNPGANSPVTALAVQRDGRVLVGGAFTTLGGQSRGRIGRLLSDGTLDGNFNPGANFPVYCLATQPDGQILAGGYFTKFGEMTRYSIARFDNGGTVETNFHPTANGPVYSLAVQPDGKILVAGDFTTLESGSTNTSGPPHTFLGRLNSNGTIDTNFTGSASNTVFALVVQPDGRIVLGGVFDRLAGSTNRCSFIARLNTNGTVDLTFTAQASDAVYSLALQADGKILVAGGFTNLCGAACRHVGRLNTDGTLDTNFTAFADATVYSLALQDDGKVLASGKFTNLCGLPRYSIGRLSNTAPAFQALQSDGATITWLRSGTLPEVSRANFAFSTNGIDWHDAGPVQRIAGGWHCSGLSLPTNATLRARGFLSGAQYGASAWFAESVTGPPGIDIQPTGGTNNAGTATRLTVLAVGTPPLSYSWLKDGVPLSGGSDIAGVQGPDLTLSNVLGGSAGGYSVIVSNALGSVTSAVASLVVLEPIVTTQPASQSTDTGQTVVFGVTAAGTAPLGYQWRKAGVDLTGGTSAALMLTNLQAGDAGDYDVVVTGSYGNATSAVAVLTVNGATADDFARGWDADGFVYPMAVQPDGKVLVGGSFTRLGTYDRSNLGRFNADGTLDTNFTAEADDAVYCLSVQPDGKILVGGSFTNLAGRACNYLGRLNPDGTLDTQFAARTDGTVYALAVQPNGAVVVGGFFTQLGGKPRANIGRLSAKGVLDDSFNPGSDLAVLSLLVEPNGKILAGGTFTRLGGQDRAHLGRLGTNGVLDASFNPGADDFVTVLAQAADGRILAGGWFNTLGGQPRARLGRLTDGGAPDAGFHPDTDGVVLSLALQSDGKIIVGGNFTNLAGVPRSYLGRLNNDGSLDLNFNPGANSFVCSLALQADGKLLAGGWFQSLGGQARGRIGRVSNTDSAAQALTFDSSTVSWLRSGAVPEITRATFESSTNGTNWASLGTATRIPGGWQLTGVLLPTNVSVRARGFLQAGYQGGASWFTETVALPRSRPLLLSKDSSFGVLSNRFGFNLTGLAGQLVVVDASSDLLNWTPIATNPLGATPSYFSDPKTTNFSRRFYRARLP